jgi:serine/threonine-protein kinase TNNI3K
VKIHFSKIYNQTVAIVADDEGNTALHFCCRNGHSQLVEILLAGERRYLANNNSSHQQLDDTGVNSFASFAHQANMYGDTPMHVACYAGKLEVVKRLLHLSATYSLTKVRERGNRWVNHFVAQENVFSETPLHAAATGGRSLDLVVYLLKQVSVHLKT